MALIKVHKSFKSMEFPPSLMLPSIFQCANNSRSRSKIALIQHERETWHYLYPWMSRKSFHINLNGSIVPIKANKEKWNWMLRVCLFEMVSIIRNWSRILVDDEIVSNSIRFSHKSEGRNCLQLMKFVMFRYWVTIPLVK